MGQTSSLLWCCCDRDRRTSTVIDDALQEKLLDETEEIKATVVCDDSPASIEQHRLSLKDSSPRGARAVSGMMPLCVESEEDDGSDGRMHRDRMDEEDDTGDDDLDSPRGSKKTGREEPKRGGTDPTSSSPWDLTSDTPTYSPENMPMRMPSDSSLLDGDVGAVEEQDRLSESSAIVRDSYSSTRDFTAPNDEDEEEEGSSDDGVGCSDSGKEAAVREAVLRRRAPPRPSSSRVFDDDMETRKSSVESSASHELRALEDQDEESDKFGSFGSELSSAESFLSRHSGTDFMGMALDDSARASDSVGTTDSDREKGSAPTSRGRSPRHGKKKGKKRR